MRTAILILISMLVLPRLTMAAADHPSTHFLVGLRWTPDQVVMNERVGSWPHYEKEDAKGMGKAMFGVRYIHPLHTRGSDGYYLETGMTLGENNTQLTAYFNDDRGVYDLRTRQYLRELSPFAGAGILWGRFRAGARYYRGYMDFRRVHQYSRGNGELLRTHDLGLRSSFAIAVEGVFWGWLHCGVEGLRTNADYQPSVDNYFNSYDVIQEQSWTMEWSSSFHNQITWALRLEVDLSSLMAGSGDDK